MGLASFQIPFPKPFQRGYRLACSLPLSPMTNFLTVKEAAKLVGKSPSSVRRILYPILESDRHPDRQQIHPTVAEAKALRVKGENFAWKISEELLRREIPEDGPKTKEDFSSATSADPQSAAIIEILRKELDIKNQQIVTQNDLLIGLSERLREGNILMGTLQQQMALGDGSRSQPNVVDADAPKTPSPEKGSDATPPKTHWLFRKLF